MGILYQVIPDQGQDDYLHDGEEDGKDQSTDYKMSCEAMRRRSVYVSYIQCAYSVEILDNMII